MGGSIGPITCFFLLAATVLDGPAALLGELLSTSLLLLDSVLSLVLRTLLALTAGGLSALSFCSDNRGLVLGTLFTRFSFSVATGESLFAVCPSTPLYKAISP